MASQPSVRFRISCALVVGALTPAFDGRSASAWADGADTIGASMLAQLDGEEAKVGRGI